jgi:Glycosyl transferases group 1
VWAEPDVDHAAELLEGVIADSARARAIAARGRRDVQLRHGYRAVGTRILARVAEVVGILASRSASSSRGKRIVLPARLGKSTPGS